jgi:hypothetical protein
MDRAGHWVFTKEGRPTEFERDQAAIASMLWHICAHELVRVPCRLKTDPLPFPREVFRTMARDGVLVWFERPGPTTREAQPIIADPDLRTKAKDKIIKVVRRRYLVMSGITIKCPLSSTLSCLPKRVR